MKCRWSSVVLLGVLLAGWGTPWVSADCLDRTFAENGWSFDGPAQIAAFVRQPDGKFVTVGTVVRNAPPFLARDFALARYDANGALDPTFGTGGSVTTPFGVYNQGYGLALALQADGKLVAVGSVAVFNGVPPLYYAPPQVAIARYAADGTLDSTFGTGGLVIGSFPASTTANGVVVLADGRIVVGGSEGSGPFGADEFFFARYAANGTIDPTFGTAGSTVILAGPSSEGIGNALVQQPDGKFAVAGSAQVLSSGSQSFAVARVDGDGIPDATFGTGGVVVTDVSPGNTDTALALVAQPDGKLVAGGWAVSHGFTLVRYHDDGSLDTGFGSAGIASTSQGVVMFGLTLDAGGNLIGVGDRWDSGIEYSVVVARFTTGGALDPTFGGGGVVATNFLVGEDDIAKAAVVEPTGSIVIAGSRGAGPLLARYLGSSCVACEAPYCPVPPACLVVANRNRLALSRFRGPNRLGWMWKGAMTPVDAGDFGSANGVFLNLQVFDGAFGGREVVSYPMSANACSDDACWTAVPGGLNFRSRTRHMSAKLRAGGVGKGSISITRRGARGEEFLPLLPLTAPVTIRLSRPDGRKCWDSTFVGAEVRVNDGGKLRARSP